MEVDKALLEKKKFKRFYLFGTVLWVLAIFLFFTSVSWLSSPDLTEGTKIFANNMRGLILTFVIFGIPIIFLLSFIIRIAEPIMDRIKARIDEKKSQ